MGNKGSKNAKGGGAGPSMNINLDPQFWTDELRSQLDLLAGNAIDVEVVKQLWQKFDTDGDGTLNKTEAQQMFLEYAKSKATSAEAAKGVDLQKLAETLWAQLDKNKDNYISVGELLGWRYSGEFNEDKRLHQKPALLGGSGYTLTELQSIPVPGKAECYHFCLSNTQPGVVFAALGEAGTSKLRIGLQDGAISIEESVALNISNLKYDGRPIPSTDLATKRVVQLKSGRLARSLDSNYKGSYGILISSVDGNNNHRFMEVGSRDFPPPPGSTTSEWILGLEVNYATGDLVVYLLSEKGYDLGDKKLMRCVVIRLPEENGGTQAEPVQVVHNFAAPHWQDDLSDGCLAVDSIRQVAYLSAAHYIAVFDISQDSKGLVEPDPFFAVVDPSVSPMFHVEKCKMTSSVHYPWRSLNVTRDGWLFGMRTETRSRHRVWAVALLMQPVNLRFNGRADFALIPFITLVKNRHAAIQVSDTIYLSGGDVFGTCLLKSKKYLSSDKAWKEKFLGLD